MPKAPKEGVLTPKHEKSTEFNVSKSLFTNQGIENLAYTMLALEGENEKAQNQARDMILEKISEDIGSLDLKQASLEEIQAKIHNYTQHKTYLEQESKDYPKEKAKEVIDALDGFIGVLQNNLIEKEEEFNKVEKEFRGEFEAKMKEIEGEKKLDVKKARLKRIRDSLTGEIDQISNDERDQTIETKKLLDLYSESVQKINDTLAGMSKGDRNVEKEVSVPVVEEEIDAKLTKIDEEGDIAKKKSEYKKLQKDLTKKIAEIKNKGADKTEREKAMLDMYVRQVQRLIPLIAEMEKVKKQTSSEVHVSDKKTASKIKPGINSKKIVVADQEFTAEDFANLIGVNTKDTQMDTTVEEFEKIKNFGELQTFLTETLASDDIEIGGKNGPFILERIEGMLREEFTTAKEMGVAELKSFQKKLLTLEDNLDTKFFFKTFNGKPDLKIGSRIPDDHANKNGKISFLRRLNALFTEALKATTDAIKEIPHKKVEVVQDHIELESWQHVKTFLTGEFLNIKITKDNENDTYEGLRFNFTQEIETATQEGPAELKEFLDEIIALGKELDAKFGFKGNTKKQFDSIGSKIPEGDNKEGKIRLLKNTYLILTKYIKEAERRLANKVKEDVSKSKSKKNSNVSSDESAIINLEARVGDLADVEALFEHVLVNQSISKEEVGPLTAKIGSILSRSLEETKHEDLDALTRFEDTIKNLKRILNSKGLIAKRLPDDQSHKKELLNNIHNIFIGLSKDIQTAKNTKRGGYVHAEPEGKHELQGNISKSDQKEAGSKKIFFNEIGDIPKLFRGGIGSIPQDHLELIDTQKSIGMMLLKEIRLVKGIKDEDEKALQIKTLTQKAKSIQQLIATFHISKGSPEMQEFFKELNNDLENFINTLNKKPKTEQEQPETPPTPTSPAPAGAETVNTAPTIEDILASVIDDRGSNGEIPKEIEKDQKFSDWMEKIAKNVYKEGGRFYYKIEDWHDLYTKQQEQMTKVKALILDEKIFAEVFENFETKEDKKFAREKMVEKLEWELVKMPTLTEQKIKNILESQEICEKQAVKMKALEAQMKAIESTGQTKKGAIPGDLAFDMIYGTGSDNAKLDAFESFIKDMDKNYSYYHGEVNEQKNEADARAEMFLLYEEAKDTVGKDDKKRWWGILGWLGKKKDKIIAKIKSKGRGRDRNYNDLQAFDATMKVLQENGLVPTETVSEEQAHRNAGELLAWSRIPEDMKLKVFTSEENKKFENIFNTVIKNKGLHSSMQEKARAVDPSYIKNSLTREIESEEASKSLNHAIAGEHLKGYGFEFADFCRDVKNESALKDLGLLSSELRGKTLTPQKLEVISQDMEKVILDDATEEVKLAHKRLSLELAQAYTRFVAQKSEVSFAPKNLPYYESIFNSSDAEISLAEKKVYAKTVRELLEKTYTKETKTLRKFSLKKLIDYFTAIEKALTSQQ